MNNSGSQSGLKESEEINDAISSHHLGVVYFLSHNPGTATQLRNDVRGEQVSPFARGPLEGQSGLPHEVRP